MATIGKNILENLTTGMYSDSKVTYREYVQNACDQIDKAIALGLLSKKEGCVTIFIDPDKRYVSIRDNATGVKSEQFRSDLGDIANSNKEQGVDKGFRGIGRLCGLAYCRTLKFTTSYQGEAISSTMTFDAEKMRKMLRDNKKYTVDEVWSAIVSFGDPVVADVNERYFEVELIDINSENTDLLDEKKVMDYLGFVAPVPYKREFLLGSSIYNHAAELGYTIDEYKIHVNGEQVLKPYTIKLKEESGKNLKNYDEISRLEFKDILDSNGHLMAWMWIGVSRFEKVIPSLNTMRGLRLRQSNIQIGEYNVLQRFFKESRGNNYFVGEIFAVSDELIPNSQRDYFNETENRVVFETMLRRYFHETLHKLYHGANEIKNAYKKQEVLLDKVTEFKEKEQANSFIDDESKARLQLEIQKAQEEAEKAQRRLEKYDDSDVSSPIAEVKARIDEKFKADDLTKKVENVKIPSVDKKPSRKKGTGYASDSLSKLNKNERKLVSKIWSIINNNAPKELAEELIEKIKEEFK